MSRRITPSRDREGNLETGVLVASKCLFVCWWSAGDSVALLCEYSQDVERLVQDGFETLD